MTLYSKSNGVWVENQLRWHAELETFPGNVWFSMKHNQNIALCSISEHKRFISSCFEQQYLLNWAGKITGWMAAVLHSPHVCIHFCNTVKKTLVHLIINPSLLFYRIIGKFSFILTCMLIVLIILVLWWWASFKTFQFMLSEAKWLSKSNKVTKKKETQAYGLIRKKNDLAWCILGDWLLLLIFLWYSCKLN